MLDLMAEGKPLTPSDAVAGVMKNGGVETGIGELFLAWLQDSIEDGTLSINEKDSVLHVLAQFVFLVSPACFYRYIATAGDGVADDKDRLQKVLSLWAYIIHEMVRGCFITINTTHQIKAVVLPKCQAT